MGFGNQHRQVFIAPTRQQLTETKLWKSVCWGVSLVSLIWPLYLYTLVPYRNSLYERLSIAATHQQIGNDECHRRCCITLIPSTPYSYVNGSSDGLVLISFQPALRLVMAILHLVPCWLCLYDLIGNCASALGNQHLPSDRTNMCLKSADDW